MTHTSPRHKDPKGTKICPCSSCRHLKGLAAFQKVRTVNNHMKEERRRVSMPKKIVELRSLITFMFLIAIGNGERADRSRNTTRPTDDDNCSGHEA